MIDPKEIRTGNWVIKITGKDLNTKSFYEYKAIALDEYYFTFAKVCFPIMITSTVLENCNFRQRQANWYIKLPVDDDNEDGQYLSLLEYRDSEKSWYLHGKRLYNQPVYLHQLQNLYYALTNLELEIHLGYFENIAMLGPINFFVKPATKSELIMKLL